MPKQSDEKSREAADNLGKLTDEKFLKLADKFINVANRENKTVIATELHMAFLYAAARYNAHVAKNILNVDDHEKYVTEMLKQYQDMLRNHLADPNL